MGRASAPIHVARIKKQHKDKTYESVLLRRTYRDGDRVRNETVASLTALPAQTIDLIERSLKGESFVGTNEAFECVRSLPHGHMHAVLGTLRRLGLEQLLDGRRSPERDMVTAMVVERIVGPRSKLATARAFAEETATSTLGELLGVSSVTENDLYAAMDWLHARKAKVEEKLAKRHLTGATLLLYDVTMTYFEGTKCKLGKFTSRRGAKSGKLHMLIGLLCEPEGRPIAVEIFEGSKGDPTTVATQVEKITKRFHIERVVLVGDRGMITNARIKEDLAPVEGLSWITALRADTIKKLVEKGEVQRSLFDKANLAEITSDDFPDERLIVCMNPLLAASRAHTREDMLRATEKVLKEIAAATQRAKSPLRGKDKIGLRAGRHINRYKMAKHFKLDITDDQFAFQRNPDSIAKEAALDGIYIIRTNVPREAMDATTTVRTYKSLSKVERAFRCMKTVDLKIRPIFHWLEDRVRAHVFLCMLAYYVEWHMREALRPMLFEEDDPAGADEQRSSPVDPVRPSPSAAAKARTKRTASGDPVHSFATLVADLGTIVRNTMKLREAEDTFVLVTTPTSLQRKIFEHLQLAVPT